MQHRYHTADLDADQSPGTRRSTTLDDTTLTARMTLAMMPSEPLLTVSEVAAYLACAQETVKRLVRRDLLPAVRVGPRLRFYQSDIERYLAERSKAPLVTEAPTAARLQRRLQDQVSAAPAAEHLRLPTLLEAICEHVAAASGDACVLVLLTDDHQRVEATACGHPEPQRCERLRTALATVPDQVGTGVIGTVIQTGQPLRIPALAPDQMRAMMRPASWPLLEDLSVASLLVVPLRVRRRVLGALALMRSQPEQPYTLADQQVLEDVAGRLALAVEHTRLYEEATRARTTATEAAARATFLAEVSQVLAAALTDEQPLARVTQQVVSFLADACIVYQCAETDVLRRTAVAHRVPHKERLLRDMEWFAIPLDADVPVTRVVQRGQTEVAAQVPADLPARVHADPDYLALVRGLAPRAYVCTPLIARGQVLGALALVITESDRIFSDDKVVLAEEVAQRVALALDNARLYHAAQEECWWQLRQRQGMSSARAEP